MRVWEFEDKKAIPSDLVREQDFILRVRRMQRQGTPSLVINLVLHSIEKLAHARGALEAVQLKLQEFAQATKGLYYEMSNGDVFLVWERSETTHLMSGRAIESALSEFGEHQNTFLLSYHMPEDYASLRERTNTYVDIVRAAASVGEMFGKIDDSRGHLTAKNVDQIEHLINEIDLHHYGRSQKLYRHVDKKWQLEGEEYFISVGDLRRERFPKLEMVRSDHFFMALCGMLDERLLKLMTESYAKFRGQVIHLNISVASIVESAFAKFVHAIPQDQRHLIGFELHRGDLFQDFSLTLSAIALLKHEGFRVFIDSVTPDMLGYLDLMAFQVDGFKINVSKERAEQLENPATLLALERMPAEKLTFFRCDNERALKVGLDIGISLFQGWLIDDLMNKKN